MQKQSHGAHSLHSYIGLSLPFQLNKLRYMRGSGANRKYIEEIQVTTLLATNKSLQASQLFIETRGS